MQDILPPRFVANNGTLTRLAESSQQSTGAMRAPSVNVLKQRSLERWFDGCRAWDGQMIRPTLMESLTW